MKMAESKDSKKTNKTVQPKKELHRLNLLEYLSNPENPFPTRTDMALKVIGFSDVSTLYQTFTPAELSAIEAEALTERRKNYSGWLAKVDFGLLKRAADGDPAACKLAYQRMESWTEKQRLEHSVTPEMLKAILEGLPEDYRVRVMASLKIGGE